jgi:hypothetical protein
MLIVVKKEESERAFFLSGESTLKGMKEREASRAAYPSDRR